MEGITQYIPGTLADVKCYNSNQFPQFRDENMVDSGYRLHFDYSLFYSTCTSTSENKCVKYVLTKCTKSRYGMGEIARIFGQDYWKSLLDGKRKWKGPLIVVKSDKVVDKSITAVPVYRDVEMGDVKYIVQYLEVLSSVVSSRDENSNAGEVKFVEIDSRSRFDRLDI
jgi:hypothetical protein